MIGEIDLWDRHLHIAHIGDRCRDRYACEMLYLPVLLDANSPTIPGKQISGNLLCGWNLHR